jgi:hypothetical protein
LPCHANRFDPVDAEPARAGRVIRASRNRTYADFAVLSMAPSRCPRSCRRSSRRRSQVP